MEQGLIHIYCGNGKGKTTCAAGLSVRCAGSGGRVLWFQFLKKDTSGERKSLGIIPNITLIPGYDKIKFTFSMTEEEKQKAREFYVHKINEIIKRVSFEHYDMLILDEVIGAINAKIIDESFILSFLKSKPTSLEIVLTGRNPSSELVDIADYVSDIQKVKHPYDQGVGARKMIEW